MKTAWENQVSLKGLSALIDAGEGLQRGASIVLCDDADTWGTSFDSVSGWVRVGPARRPEDSPMLTRIAGGCLLGLADGMVQELWLHPQFVDG